MRAPPYKNKKYTILARNLKGTFSNRVEKKTLTSRPCVRIFKMFEELRKKAKMCSQRNMSILCIRIFSVSFKFLQSHEWETRYMRLNEF